MENPEPFAGPDVKAADISDRARRGGLASHGGVRRADHDHIAGDQRRGVETNNGMDEIEILVVFLLQVDHPVVAELRNQMSRLGIQRDHTVSRRDEDDPLVGSIGARPVRETAPRASARSELAADALVELIHPENLAGAGIHGQNRPRRSGRGVEDSVHQQGRSRIEPVGSWPQIVCIQPPRDLQLAEILFVDLVERSVFGARQIGSVGGPVRVRGGSG